MIYHYNLTREGERKDSLMSLSNRRVTFHLIRVEFVVSLGTLSPASRFNFRTRTSRLSKRCAAGNGLQGSLRDRRSTRSAAGEKQKILIARAR